MAFWLSFLLENIDKFRISSTVYLVGIEVYLPRHAQHTKKFLAHFIHDPPRSPDFINVKPWPNGLASRRKLKTWVYSRLRLARPCVHLRWLAVTCAHFRRDQICTQVKASFSPFGHLTQVNASWVTSINGLLSNEIQDMSALKWFFCDSRVLVRKLASAFGHPTPVSTQVQLAPTCDYLPVRLTKA